MPYDESILENNDVGEESVLSDSEHMEDEVNEGKTPDSDNGADHDNVQDGNNGVNDGALSGEGSDFETSAEENADKEEQTDSEGKTENSAETSSKQESDVAESVTESPVEGALPTDEEDSEESSETVESGVSGGSGGGSGGSGGGLDSASVREIIDEYLLGSGTENSESVRLSYSLASSSDSDAFIEVSADEFNSMVLERLDAIAISAMLTTCFVFFIFLTKGRR